MRFTLPVLVIVLFPAAAFGQPRDNDALVQQRFDQQRAVAAENRLNTLEAQVQTERRITDLRAQQPSPEPGARDTRLPESSMAGYASIPDAMLADSNARVREASQGKR